MAKTKNGLDFGVFRPEPTPQKAPPDPQAKHLVCTVPKGKPRFLSDDNTFAIWHANFEDDSGAVYSVIIRGDLGRVVGGETLSCEGFWKKHPKHGWAFHVTSYSSALPSTASGVAEWLQVRIDGIGPTFARAIVQHFGHAEVYDILDADPKRLCEVKSPSGRKMPQKQVEKAVAAWGEVRAIRQIETFLYSHGVSANLAGKLYRKYGPDVVKVLREDPYRITEMSGIGFKIADAVARSMGVALDDPKRIMAAILFVLKEAESQGHTFLALRQLLGHTIEALTPPGTEPPLEVRDHQKIVYAASQLSSQGKVIAEDDEYLEQRIYAKRMHLMECELARKLRHLLETPAQPLMKKTERPMAPDGASDKDILRLRLPSDAQWSVVDMVRLHRLSLLTGGPGTGKTTAQKILIQKLREAGKTVKMAAPTGKAARRMQEVTNHPATTIHRLLEWAPFVGGFQRNEDNPIEADCLIIDEASMLSLDLAFSLFRAVGDSTHVLVVGDPDQLAPVGAGKVLDDLLKSEKAPRVHLAKIFRQAAKSMIIQNSRRLNTGQLPYFRRAEAEAALGQEMLDDFFWITRHTPEDTAALTLDLACNRLPRSLGFDPKRDIIVLAPMREGKVGLHYLNAELERRLNMGEDGKPKKAIIQRHYRLGGQRIEANISVGSRIVQTKNDHHNEVMNGELALVLDYDELENSMLLSLDDGARELWLPVPDAETYQLAWALTTHKSQGSEFPCVLVPVSTAHYVMLNRALYYTAVTRAKKLCVMIGEKRALQMAVKNPDLKKRNSTLAARILDPSLSGELF